MRPRPDLASVTELRRALAGPAPVLPSKYLWDRRGARLHRARALQPEFYPARVEHELLVTHAATITGLVEPREVADLSAGASRSIRPLLDAMLRGGHGVHCALVDHDPALLVASVLRLAADYPRLDVRGAVADGPDGGWRLGRGGGRLLLISGAGTDGLDPESLPGLLARLGAAMAPDDALLLSVDLGADPERLAAAGDDAAGVAAAFHRNVLEVINRRFGADFDPRAFTFEAAWDPTHAWLETRLRPRRPVRVRVRAAGMVLTLDEARPLRTGRVGTWDRPTLRAAAAPASLVLSAWLTDPEERRALALLRRG
jgi:L-histidine N-alpha-methyltransferase